MTAADRLAQALRTIRDWPARDGSMLDGAKQVAAEALAAHDAAQSLAEGDALPRNIRDALVRALKWAPPEHVACIRQAINDLDGAAPEVRPKAEEWERPRLHMLFSHRSALAAQFGFRLSPQFNGLVSAVIKWAQAELTPNGQPKGMPTNALAGAVCTVAEARGFVAFGAGVYRIQETQEPGLVVTFRRDGEQHYGIGDLAPEVDLTPIPADDIIVRLQFTSAAGLDSLEHHLRSIRAQHWPETVRSSAPAPDTLRKIVALTSRVPGMTERELGLSMGRIQEICEAALAAPCAAVGADDVLDAARYRWLRNEADHLHVAEGSPQVCMTDEWGEIISVKTLAYPRGASLDAAVDAAMASYPPVQHKEAER